MRVPSSSFEVSSSTVRMPMRFSGISFAYNVAYAIFGGMTPLFVTLLMQHQNLAPAHYVAVLCIVGVVLALRARHTVAT